MRQLGLFLIGALTATVLVVAGRSFAAPEKTSKEESLRATRACVYALGGWTEVDCSAAAAYSAALNANSRYVVQCSTNARWASDDPTQTAADGNDGYAPGGAWFDFYTTDSIRYYTCDASADGAGLCRHIECK